MPATPDLKHLQVCLGSGELFGVFGDEGGPPAYEQRCRWVDCPNQSRSWHQPQTDLPEPPGDFPELVELCHCCARTVIPSGSKFSSFFCGPCREQVLAIDQRYGAAVIPLGRHSFMNSVTLRRGASPGAAAFVAAMESLWKRIGRLTEWRRQLIEDRASVLDADTDGRVPLTAYLALASVDGQSDEELFVSLCWDFGLTPTR